MLVQALLLGALLMLLWLYLKKPAGMPPGRWGLPLVGYIPLTRKSVDEQLVELHRQYGDIYLWRLGTVVTVFIHDYKLSREAYNRPEITNRPEWGSFNFLEKEALGLSATSGIRWHNNRRFTLRQLREMGMGKSSLVYAIHDQAVQLVEVLRGQAGQPAALIPDNIELAVNNIIWQMVGGKTFSADDPKLKEFHYLMDTFMEATSRLVIRDWFPWSKYIMPGFIFRKIAMLDFVDQSKEKFLTYFFKVIDEHRATLDRDNPRDVIDGYLIQMQDEKDDPNSTCTERDLAFLVLDLFFTGSITTVSTLKYFIYYMIKYPHVQSKLQAELDQALPQGSFATMEDKPQLRYLDAAVNEVLRVAPFANMGVQHEVTSDTKLGGYFLPKGTMVNAAILAQHHDPRYWDDPYTFLPERWLDADGKFVSKKEGNQPFGVGKRQCPGENLSRMELFVFLAAIFKNFSFSAAPGESITVDPMPGMPLFNMPQPQKVVITTRN